MYKIFSVIESNKHKYVRLETENIKDAKKFIKERLKSLNISKYSLLDKNKKGFSHYIKEGDFEIFSNSNFIWHSTPDDWEFTWIEGPSINGFKEGLQTNMLDKDIILSTKEINLTKLAKEGKIPVFYHNNWRDEYYTDIFSEINEPAERLNTNLMCDIKADISYIELTLNKYTKDFKTSLFISKDIIDRISLDFCNVDNLGSLRFILRLDNKIVYGAGSSGFEILDAIQFLQQWNFKVNKKLIQKIYKELHNKDIVSKPEFYEYQERINTLNNLIQR